MEKHFVEYRKMYFNQLIADYNEGFVCYFLKRVQHFFYLGAPYFITYFFYIQIRKKVKTGLRSPGPGL